MKVKDLIAALLSMPRDDEVKARVALDGLWHVARVVGVRRLNETVGTFTSIETLLEIETTVTFKVKDQ